MAPYSRMLAATLALALTSFFRVGAGSAASPSTPSEWNQAYAACVGGFESARVVPKTAVPTVCSCMVNELGRMPEADRDSAFQQIARRCVQSATTGGGVYAPAAETTTKHAINKEFHVSIAYPESWAEIPVGVPNEIFRFFSENGKGSGGCTVAANDTKIRTNTDESIVAAYKLLPDLMEARLLDGFKNPKIFNRNITTISNFKAISIFYSGTYSTLGDEYNMHMWSIITQKFGVIYTISCGDLDNRFQNSIATFRNIVSSFLIFP